MRHKCWSVKTLNPVLLPGIFSCYHFSDTIRPQRRKFLHQRLISLPNMHRALSPWAYREIRKKPSEYLCAYTSCTQKHRHCCRHINISIHIMHVYKYGFHTDTTVPAFCQAKWILACVIITIIIVECRIIEGNKIKKFE